MATKNVPDTIRERMKHVTIPVVYEQAIAALAECRAIPDAQYWDNAADALAAWAKIHKDERAQLEAKRLKLHAYRKMGELAAQLQPCIRLGGTKTTPGPLSLLQQFGISKTTAGTMRSIARMPQKQFDLTVAQTKNLGVSTVRRLSVEMNGGTGARNPVTPARFKFSKAFTHMQSLMKNNDPKLFASQFDPGESKITRRQIVELQEWLDLFEMHLPKEKP